MSAESGTFKLRTQSPGGSVVVSGPIALKQNAGALDGPATATEIQSVLNAKLGANNTAVTWNAVEHRFEVTFQDPGAVTTFNVENANLFNSLDANPIALGPLLAFPDAASSDTLVRQTLVVTDATTGTFGMNIEGQAISNLPANLTAAELKAQISAGYSNATLDVTGSGAADDPFVIRYTLSSGTPTGINGLDLSGLLRVLDTPRGEVATTTDGRAAAPEAHELRFQDLAAGDKFTLAYSGKSTSQIVWDANLDIVRDRLQTVLTALVGMQHRLPSIRSTFSAAWGSEPTFTVNVRPLTAGIFTPTVVETTSGSATAAKVNDAIAGQDEVQQVTYVANHGSFKLSRAGTSTAAIAWDADTTQLEAAIQAALHVDVTATKQTTGTTTTWSITFSGAPQTDVPQLLLDTTELKQTQPLQQVLALDLKVGTSPVAEVQRIISHLKSGKFRLGFNGGMTPELDWNSPAATLMTELNALKSAGQADPVASVTGTGATNDPWIVTFTAGTNFDAITAFTARDLSQRLSGFSGRLLNMTGINYGWGINALLGSDVVIDSIIEQSTTDNISAPQQKILKGLLGGDTLSISGGKTLWEFVVENTVGKIDVNPNSPVGQMLARWGALQEDKGIAGALAKSANFLASTILDEATGLLKDQLSHQLGSLIDTPFNPGFHVLAGLSGGDTYKFSGFWGLAIVPEIPGVTLVGDVINGHDTLDFSEVGSNLRFDVWSVTTQNKDQLAAMFADANAQVTGGPDIVANLFEVGTNFVVVRDTTLADLPIISDFLADTPFFQIASGNTVFATDIENIVGGSGDNTIVLHDGATLTGTIAAEGPVELDYSDYNLSGQERQDINLKESRSGTFTLSIQDPNNSSNTLTTAAITIALSGSNVDYEATAQNIQAALNHASVLGPSAVTVNALPASPGTFSVLFTAIHDYAALTITPSNLQDADGNSVTPQVVTLAAGGNATGVTVNGATGEKEIIPEVTIPLLGTLPSVSWNFGKAQGISGYRLGALGEVLADLGITDDLFRDYAVANLTNVTGSPRNDTLTGNQGDNTFDLSSGGQDTVDGGDGSDTVAYAAADQSIVIDLRLPSVDVVQTGDSQAGDNELQLIDLGQANGGTFKLTFNDPTATGGERPLTTAEITWDSDSAVTRSNIEKALNLQFDAPNNVFQDAGSNSVSTLFDGSTLAVRVTEGMTSNTWRVEFTQPAATPVGPMTLQTDDLALADTMHSYFATPQQGTATIDTTTASTQLFALHGALRVGDKWKMTVASVPYEHTVAGGDTAADVAAALATQINAATGFASSGATARCPSPNWTAARSRQRPTSTRTPA